MQRMVRGLLADRFKLVMRVEQKTMRSMRSPWQGEVRVSQHTTRLPPSDVERR
jgi:hypothetical protein